jgi:hypothetical protein
MTTMIKYRFYATILDAFQDYLSSSEIYQKYWGFSEEPPKSEEEFEKEQFQSLIDRINRVPFDSEAADRGTVFNEVIDCLVEKRKSDKVELVSDKSAGTITGTYNNRSFIFSLSQCLEVAGYFKEAVCQIRTSGIISTKYGDVELYGNIDEVLPCSVHDIKTKGRYSAFDFKNHWQHIVYPYCLINSGTPLCDFIYNVYVMNKSNVITERHEEFYSFVPERDTPKLRLHCEAFIEFLELNKGLITDKKIFNQLDNE